MSLQLQSVPKVWKHATIIPVAKTKHPKELNDFRPVALTSLVMKTFEKIVKQDILRQTEGLLDPLQFAYQPGRGVEDATLVLINLLIQHLERFQKHTLDFYLLTFRPHLIQSSPTCLQRNSSHSLI